MDSKTIKEWLDDISTRTGASVSGDRTLSYDETEKIIGYITNLENALDEIENILNACGEMACYTKSRCLLEEDIEDIEEIIKKTKGE